MTYRHGVYVNEMESSQVAPETYKPECQTWDHYGTYG